MIEIRRILTHVEDIHHEFGPVAAVPLRRGAIAVVLTNPFAGRYEPNIVPMMEALNPLGVDMAERLRAAMEKAPLFHDAGTIHFTASFGVAVGGRGVETLDRLLQEADKALYEAKEGGRNRVVCRR